MPRRGGVCLVFALRSFCVRGRTRALYGRATDRQRTSDRRQTGGHSSDADILRHSKMGGGAVGGRDEARPSRCGGRLRGTRTGNGLPYRTSSSPSLCDMGGRQVSVARPSGARVKSYLVVPAVFYTASLPLDIEIML